MNPVPLQLLPLKVSYNHPTASLQLVDRLSKHIREVSPEKRIAVVCIGTDRSTGDALGPITGYMLGKYRCAGFDLFGTLEQPVHAMNLDETLEQLHQSIPDPYIIGIDACLGKAANIGLIKVGDGPVYPGSGVNKQLTPVGDMHISAVVNAGGSLEYLTLQSTRLHVVMRMAHLVACSLFLAINRRVTSPT